MFRRERVKTLCQSAGIILTDWSCFPCAGPAVRLLPACRPHLNFRKPGDTKKAGTKKRPPQAVPPGTAINRPESIVRDGSLCFDSVPAIAAFVHCATVTGIEAMLGSLPTTDSVVTAIEDAAIGVARSGSTVAVAALLVDSTSRVISNNTVVFPWQNGRNPVSVVTGVHVVLPSTGIVVVEATCTSCAGLQRIVHAPAGGPLASVGQLRTAFGATGEDHVADVVVVPVARITLRQVRRGVAASTVAHDLAVVAALAVRVQADL